MSHTAKLNTAGLPEPSAPERGQERSQKGSQDLELIRSLYVHFPFCETKCHYCDFYSIGREKTSDEMPNLFERALFQEASLIMKEYSEKVAPRFSTIFLGGGTPSMTPASSMARALAPLKIQHRIDEDTEWTMEANPSSLHVDELKDYRSFGINRISMGVQALNDILLADLGRVHSRDTALRALEMIFQSGIRNVSVDLLCGVPGQKIEDLEEAMDTLTSFPITHLSCYLLTLPKGHRMYPMLPDEDTQLQHLLFIDRYMTAKGFEHYEISNFAKPGYRARHNLTYWKNLSYLGLGPSAHSFYRSIDRGPGIRWKNVSSLHRYAVKVLEENTLPIEWRETLTSEQKYLEDWMLALRLDEGFPVSWLKTPLQKERAKRFIEENLMEIHPSDKTRFRLTPKGFALSDQLISAFALADTEN